jgi:hypothetical protein
LGGTDVYIEVESVFDNYTFDAFEPPWNGPTLNIPSEEDQNDPTTYQISMPAYIALQNYLRGTLNGFVSSDGKSTSYISDNQIREVIGPVEDAMQALYDPFDSCTDMFDSEIVDPAVYSISDMALGMTQMIRIQYFEFTDFSTNFVIGRTYIPKPTVEVAWPWMVPICGLWILCLILTVGTMWKAQRHTDANMRLNPLHFILLNYAGTLPGMDSDERVEEFADRTRVRLAMKDRQMSFIPGYSSDSVAV